MLGSEGLNSCPFSDGHSACFTKSMSQHVALYLAFGALGFLAGIAWTQARHRKTLGHTVAAEAVVTEESRSTTGSKTWHKRSYAGW